MKIIEQSYEIDESFDPETEIRKICKGYCTCYKTPLPQTFEEQCALIKRHRNHGSPQEHGFMTVTFITNRGVANEFVRHRHTGYSQQSTRYCNYSKNKFGNSLTFIQDSSVIDDPYLYQTWLNGRKADEEEYLARLQAGQKPEEARGCLPSDLATEIEVSTNLREWHAIFELRCSRHAHYQIRALMLPLLREMQRVLPCIYDDIAW